jgi:putative MATE family efflux protein
MGLGAPLLLAALASSSSGLIDSSMMGHYGARDLAAVSGASAIFDFFSSLVLASLAGHQILAARFAGAGDNDAVRASFRLSVACCGGFAVLLTAACIAAGRPLTGLISNGRGDLAHIGSEYLAARAPTLLLIVPFGLLVTTLNAHKLVRCALIAGLTVNCSNLLLDVLLIYGSGPFPRLGAVGNGLATTVSWLLGICYLWFASARSGFPVPSMISTRCRVPHANFQTSIVKLGWPAMTSAAIDYARIIAFFAIIGSISEAALAGGRLAFEVNIFLFGVTSAFASGGRVLIGRAAGAGQPDHAREYRRTMRLALLAPAIVVAIVLAVVPGVVAQLLTSYDSVARAAGTAFPLVGLSIVAMAWTFGNVTLIRALGHTRWDMWANVTSAVLVQLPVAWVLTVALHLELHGAFASVLCYWLARAIITQLFAARALRGISTDDQAVPSLNATTVSDQTGGNHVARRLVAWLGGRKEAYRNG